MQKFYTIYMFYMAKQKALQSIHCILLK